MDYRTKFISEELVTDDKNFDARVVRQRLWLACLEKLKEVNPQDMAATFTFSIFHVKFNSDDMLCRLTVYIRSDDPINEHSYIL